MSVASSDSAHAARLKPVGYAGGVAACLLAALLFGATTPATKGLSERVDPQVLAALLYLGVALGALPWAVRGWRVIPRLPAGQVLKIGLACVAGGAIAPVLLMMALSRAPAASTSLWLTLETVWTALLAWFAFREHADRPTIVAVILVTAAGALLASPDHMSAGVPALLIAIACLCWGLDNNLTATIDRVTPGQLALAKATVAITINFGVAGLRGAPLPSASDAAEAITIGIVGYGVSLMLYIRGSQKLGASRAQMIFALAPFVGAMGAWLVLGEAATPLQFGALGLMVVAWVVLQRGHHAHEHHHDAVEHTHAHRHDDGHHDHVHADLPAAASHTHVHEHGMLEHSHPHLPDLHHRHGHHPAG
jgi:drug/metabolite transporter (DMT)-like permease